MEYSRRKKRRRRNLYIDSDVQGAIIKRVIMYWCACLLFLTLPIILVMTLFEPSVSWIDHAPKVMSRFWPVYLIMVALLPFLIRDALTLSHRFCGPVTRVLKGLDEFCETGVFTEIRFRDQDFWKPMAIAINLAIAKSGSDTVSLPSSEERSGCR